MADKYSSQELMKPYQNNPVKKKKNYGADGQMAIAKDTKHPHGKWVSDTYNRLRKEAETDPDAEKAMQDYSNVLEHQGSRLLYQGRTYANPDFNTSERSGGAGDSINEATKKANKAYNDATTKRIKTQKAGEYVLKSKDQGKSQKKKRADEYNGPMSRNR